MTPKQEEKAKINHPTVWLVWDIEYVEGFAYEQLRAICTEEWVANIDAQIVREEAKTHNRRVLVEVRPTLLNHLFGWAMLQKFNNLFS